MDGFSEDETVVVVGVSTGTLVLATKASSPLPCRSLTLTTPTGSEIQLRTLLVGGRYDECRPEHMAEMHRRIAGSQHEIIEDASHLCFAEQTETFAGIVNTFLAAAEG